ncbi:MAG: peptidylprolyl isomerase [Oscillospiraceae bacterium]|nr:peptidylprolyl isomerase [Oscillospiraceae bacterium]
MKLRNKIIAAALAAFCLFSTGCSSSPSASGASGIDPSVIGTTGDGNVNFQLKAGDKIAEITISGYGTIKAKLFPEVAPVGVENFIKLAEKGYYDGKNIHRVVADFMLQGGSLNGDGTGGEAAAGGDFSIEPNYNARHFYGALCYANAMGRNTTQFYIVNAKSAELFTDEDIEMISRNVDVCRAYRDSYDKNDTGYQYWDNMATYYNNLTSMIENATDDINSKYESEGGTPSLDGGYTVFGQVYEGFDVIDSVSACKVKTNSGGELSEPVDTITIESVKITEYVG